MKRSFAWVAILAALATPLVWGRPAAAQKTGGTLVQITQPEPPNLASYISTSGPIGQVTAKIFDGLLEYDFNLQPQPSLAESFVVSPDGKTITFKIRQNVKFHDGKPLTVEDIRFTFMDVLKKVHPRGIATFRELAAVETPDTSTVIFKLNQPAPYLMMTLSGYESPILPKHIYGEGDIKAHPNANTPIGSGPFKFVEWRRGEFVRLDRNKDYWRPGQPYLDRIVVRFISDSATRTAVVEKGEAHVAGFGAVPYNDVKKLQALPSIEVTRKGYEMISPVVELTLNTKQAPFNNEKVRQAMAYAIDRQFAIDTIWFGYGRPAAGVISSNFASSGLFTPGKDFTVANRIELANKLLDEAGFPRKADGVRFEMVHDLTPYGEEWQRFGEYVQQALGQIGIKVTLRYEDVAKWLKRVYTDYDFMMTSNFLYNLADPVLGVHRSFHSDRIRPGTVFVNAAQWSSPETDKIMNEATVEPDAKKRNALYHDLIRLTSEASPIIYVLELQFPTIVNKQFKNVITSPLGIYGNFASAYKE